MRKATTYMEIDVNGELDAPVIGQVLKNGNFEVTVIEVIECCDVWHVFGNHNL